MSIKKQQYKATIIKQNVIGSNATLLLQIDPEIAYLEGHFDHYPLLAGVVQIDWLSITEENYWLVTLFLEEWK